jgi:hypothetical protein
MAQVEVARRAAGAVNLMGQRFGRLMVDPVTWGSSNRTNVGLPLHLRERAPRPERHTAERPIHELRLSRA